MNNRSDENKIIRIILLIILSIYSVFFILLVPEFYKVGGIKLILIIIAMILSIIAINTLINDFNINKKLHKKKK